MFVSVWRKSVSRFLFHGERKFLNPPQHGKKLFYGIAEHLIQFFTFSCGKEAERIFYRSVEKAFPHFSLFPLKIGLTKCPSVFKTLQVEYRGTVTSQNKFEENSEANLKLMQKRENLLSHKQFHFHHITHYLVRRKGILADAGSTHTNWSYTWKFFTLEDLC